MLRIQEAPETCLGALCVTSHGIYVLIVSPTYFPSAQNKIENHVTTISMNTNAPRIGSRVARGLDQPPSRGAVCAVEAEDEIAVLGDVLLYWYTYVYPFTNSLSLLAWRAKRVRTY